jgi:hypothetical protein
VAPPRQLSEEAFRVIEVHQLVAVLLGVGTALVYPTLLAAVGDVAHPGWRARSVVYRLWRAALELG